MEECPLVTSYLLFVATVIESSPLYENKLARLRLLQHAASYAGATRTLLTLRAFYALEVMVYRGLPLTQVIGMPRLELRQWGRSASGLTKLLARLEEERVDTVGGVVEYALDPSVHRNVEQMAQAKRKSKLIALDDVAKCARLLRRALLTTQTWRTLSYVGPRLFWRLDAGAVDRLLDVAQGLLNVSETNARRAWETQSET